MPVAIPLVSAAAPDAALPVVRPTPLEVALIGWTQKPGETAPSKT